MTNRRSLLKLNSAVAVVAIIAAIMMMMMATGYVVAKRTSASRCAKLCSQREKQIGSDPLCHLRCAKSGFLGDDELESDDIIFHEDQDSPISDSELMEMIMNNIHEHSIDEEAESQSDAHSSSSASASNGEVDPADVWQRYRGELIRFIRKGAAVKSNDKQFSNLQIVTTPIDAEWDNNDAILQTLCHAAPAWTSSYSPNTLSAPFHERYRQFLANLNIDSSAISDTRNNQLDALLRQMENESFALQDRLFDERDKCEARYTRMVISYRERTPFENYSQTSCPRYVGLEQDAKTLQGKQELAAREAFGGFKNYSARRAINKVSTTSNKRFLEINPLRNFVSRNSKGEHSSFTFTVNSKSTYEQSSMKSSSFGIGIIVLNFNSQKKEERLTTRMEDFQMEMSAKSWTAINVIPDPAWFDSGVLHEWRNGPFKSGTNAQWFGASGKVNLIPRTFYVVYKPKLTLRLNKVDVDKFEKSKSMSIGISLFGIGFNFGKGSRLSTLQEKDNVFKVTVENDSDVPQVIAVDMIQLP